MVSLWCSGWTERKSWLIWVGSTKNPVCLSFSSRGDGESEKRPWSVISCEGNLGCTSKRTKVVSQKKRLIVPRFGREP